jgi:NADH-quinone oxidoreductase subunit M
MEDKLVFGVVASLGVALAAVYMIRLFQRSMHNREGEGTESRDVGVFDFAVIAPLTLVIVALGVYPQVMLDPAEKATNARVKPAAQVADGDSQTADGSTP